MKIRPLNRLTHSNTLKTLWMICAVTLVLLGTGSLHVSHAQSSPEGVVSAFLDQWKVKNYQAMYDLIAPESQQLYDFPVFETYYTTADTATSMSDITYEIVAVMPQGASTAVEYDLTMVSGVFSPIIDPGRIMRLLQTPNGWRVAWSTMDIFDGLASGTQIRAAGQRDARANIYDREGDLVVQQGGTVVSLYISRQNSINEEDCLSLMAELLRRQRQDLVALFGRFLPDALFYIGEVDADVYAARQQDIADTCGSIVPIERQTRHYYRGNAMAHVTGYVGQIPADNLQFWLDQGYQPGDLIGRSGVELAFERELSGQGESILRITESGGTVIRELGSTTGSAPQAVVMTIDRDIQYAVAQALADAYNFAEGNWGSRDVSPGAAAVVLDIKTGGILGMSSYPLFEPDIFNPDTECCSPITAGERISDLLADTRRPLFNRAIQGQFAPGSVHKIVTTAAVNEEDIWQADQIFECGLSWDGRAYGDTAGYERRDWRFTDGLEATGPIVHWQALASSCDPFYYQMGAMLFRQGGPNTLNEYARRMGLGQPIGLDYFGTEAAGQLPTPNNESDAINEAIGQGDVQVTPLQMAKLVVAIANGGTVYQPYLVEQVGGLEGQPVTFKAEPETIRELGFSAETMTLVRQGMCAGTTDETYGTAVWPFEEAPYTVCGKTGTAQTSRYPNAWFVAYAPADDPQIAIAVVVEQALEGSQTAAPIARRIMDYYFNQPTWGYPGLWLDPYTPLQAPEGGTLGG